MKRIMSLFAVLALLTLGACSVFSDAGMESVHGSMKNPCSMNPCSANVNTPIRSHAFDSFKQAAAAGKKLWGDESLGISGLACLSCHADNELLNLDRVGQFPHFVKMVGEVVSLDQMINYCMLNPMKGKQFAKNSKELTAMAAYYRQLRVGFDNTRVQ